MIKHPTVWMLVAVCIGSVAEFLESHSERIRELSAAVLVGVMLEFLRTFGEWIKKRRDRQQPPSSPTAA